MRVEREIGKITGVGLGEEARRSCRRVMGMRGEISGIRWGNGNGKVRVDRHQRFQMQIKRGVVPKVYRVSILCGMRYRLFFIWQKSSVYVKRLIASHPSYVIG